MYILSGVITSVLSLVIGMLVGRVSSFAKREREHDRALMDGVGMLLRIELIHVHDKWPNGDAPDKIKENTQGVYDAYHSLGLNGFGTKLYNDIMDGSSNGSKQSRD